MTASKAIVVSGYARTPIGGLLGCLAPMTASDLGAAAIREALARAKADPAAVEEVAMGCVLPAGQGQAPARQAGRKAGIPDSAGAVTLNKMCGSGMKTLMMAADGLIAGSIDLAVAGGMESMTNAPFLQPKLRAGHKYGHVTTYDHMALDGLEDAYEPGRAMGTYAEDCADRYQFTRGEQDAYAIRSLERARRAIGDGSFAAEIVAVAVPGKAGATEIATDEQPGRGKPDAIPKLKPAFRRDGTVTAASSSSISDGAAALVLSREADARAAGRPVLARIIAQATHAQEPRWFTTAPVDAIGKVLARAGWSVGDVDLFEVNEAFAVVPMAAMRELSIPEDRINVNGGACALGHPIGASGARIVVTLLSAMKARGLTRGIASLCIGGGEATAMAFELVG
ncbi:MAG: acetyl-CoA C-acyltransferase [Hyphomicrobiaceae bacterium]